MKVHHIGYLVKHMERAVPEFLSMGYQASEMVYDPQRKIKITFLDHATGGGGGGYWVVLTGST